MTKRVVSSDQVFHLWAHQAQDSARNGTGSVFFEWDTVYSYRQSWPLARIFKKGPKAVVKAGVYQNVLVLTNSEKCSVTTSQHQSAANRAASHLPQVAVPELLCNSLHTVAQDHAANLAYLEKAAADLLAKAQRAMSASNVNWRSERASQLQNDAQAYAKFFGIRRKIAFYDAAAWTAAIQRAQRIENPDPVLDAKRLKAREMRATSERAKLQVQYDDYCARVAAYNAEWDVAQTKTPEQRAQHWRDTGQWLACDNPASYPPRLDHATVRRMRNAGFELSRPHHESRGGRSYYSDVLLRVQDNEIVTSLGARIPKDHAPRIWRLVRACMEHGREYIRNGHTEHAGAFAIDRIDTDGTLTAGCHTIKYDEIERMARTLELA